MTEAEFVHAYEVVGADFTNAGRASTAIKETLKNMGLASPLVRRVAIAAYEAEMNMVMYARRGTMTLRVTPDDVTIDARDEGPGIADIAMAMQEGFSTATPEMRELGFGAGMGLPNIKRNTDELAISSEVNRGTAVVMKVHIGGSGAGDSSAGTRQ
jgi:anti-sigma regulatory factor (Ser/Thr protein kinase)